MSLFDLGVIGLILGKLLGFPRPAVQRVRSRPYRPRGGRVRVLFLMMGIAIAGPSTEAVASVTEMTPPNGTRVDQIAQPDTTLNVIAVSQSTHDTSAYPDAKLNTASLAGPIPAEPLYSDSFLTDTARTDTTAAGLDPAFSDLSNDLYIDLFVLGDLYLDGENSLQVQLGASAGFFADSFLIPVPEPTGAAILGCSVLGFLANTRMGRSRFPSF